MAREATQPLTVEEGINFRDLLSNAIGKNFNDITQTDVREWAAANGWRKKDVNRVARGFTKFSKRGGDYALTSPGEFEVAGAGPASGRKTGNVKGFDVGDLIGLGRDVSTLAGALEMNQSRKSNSPSKQSAFDINDVAQFNSSLFGGMPQEQVESYTKEKGASGVKGQQQSASRNQQQQKDASPLQGAAPESIPELSVSSLSRDPNFWLLNPNPNDFGGNVRLGDGSSKQYEKGEDRTVTNPYTGETMELTEEQKKKYDAMGESLGDDTGFFADLFKNTFSLPSRPEAWEEGPLATGTPTVDMAGFLDEVFGTNVKDIPILGGLLENFGPGGVKAPPQSLGTLLGKQAPTFSNSFVKELGKKLGKSADDVLAMGKKVGEKLKKFAELTPQEQKFFNTIKKLVTKERIPIERRLPQTAESLKDVIYTKPPNVGFRPKVRRFGGKI